MLSFPFVKMFQNNHLVAFEVIASFISNWCQNWFEFFPHPPVNILTCVENILSYHDLRVLKYLSEHQISPKIYCWPLLYTVFSEVLSANEWMTLMDHVISNHPGFLLCVCAVYVSNSSQALYTCSERRDFEYYFHNRNRIHIKRLITTAYSLWETLPPELSPKSIMSGFKPLARGDYPVFNKFPEKVVQYQLKERERIHEQELEYIKQRQMTEELRSHTQRLQQQEETWKKEQEMLADAEAQRRQLLVEEEDKLAEQRQRLQAMKRELRLREVEVLDLARKNFLETAEKDHQSRVQQLEKEIQRKSRLRETETRAAVEEVALKELEIETQRCLLEQELLREQYAVRRREEVHNAGKADREAILQQHFNLDDSVEGNAATARVQEAQHDLARSAIKSQALRHQSDFERARHIDAIYTELAVNDLRAHEAKSLTDKEALETVVKEKTKDLHIDILEQRKAIAEQKAATLATQERVEELYKEMKGMKSGGDSDDKEDDTSDKRIQFLRRRATLDREQSELLRNVRDLRTNLIKHKDRDVAVDLQL